MNPSLVGSLGSNEYATIKYDQVENLSSELLDRLMCFKDLLRYLQSVITNLSDYEPRNDVRNPINVSFKELLSVQNRMRQETTKILDAIEVLRRDPWSHKRQVSMKQWEGPQPANDLAEVATPAAAGQNPVISTDEVVTHLTVGGGAEQLTFDFGSLSSPDPWKQSLPIRKLAAMFDANNTYRIAQSPKAMSREHKQQLDISQLRHSDETQKMTDEALKVSNELKTARQMLSDKDNEIRDMTSKLAHVEAKFVDLRNDREETMSQLSTATWQIGFNRGSNNLDPNCHRRTVLICLRVIPHTAIDFCGGWSSMSLFSSTFCL